ncbi:MAG: hypothetical protein KY395_06555 [Actinobacteria bacterium]|nr:hypothetical protein [Actinomycetota bacterium]
MITAGGGRRKPADTEGEAPGEEQTEAAKPILPEIDPEMERLLAEEEDIERRTREHHETPHMPKESD